MCIKTQFPQNRTLPRFAKSKQHFIPKIGIIWFVVTKILCHFRLISETSWIKWNKFASRATRSNCFSVARHGHSSSPMYWVLSDPRGWTPVPRPFKVKGALESTQAADFWPKSQILHISKMSLMREKVSPWFLTDKGDDIHIRKLVAMADENKSEEQIDKQHLQISINYGGGKEVLGQLGLGIQALAGYK